jgi:hypothetical protein
MLALQTWLRSKLTKRIEWTAAVDPPSMTTGQLGAWTVTVAIPGVALGDVVSCGPGIDLSGIVYSSRVSAAGVVSIDFYNPTAGTLNIASSTWRIVVEKYKKG